jgi:hypothetical protein
LTEPGECDWLQYFHNSASTDADAPRRCRNIPQEPPSTDPKPFPGVGTVTALGKLTFPVVPVGWENLYDNFGDTEADYTFCALTLEKNGFYRKYAGFA